MKLTGNQETGLHWVARRNTPRVHEKENLLRNPKKTHALQVRRHGFGRTLHSLKMKGLLEYSNETGYFFTEEGRALEQKLWDELLSFRKVMEAVVKHHRA